MSRVVIRKAEDGKLHGIDEKNERAYQKFRRMVADMEHGQTASFAFRMPRSPAHHRLFFAKLGSLINRTEAFDDQDKLRYWLTMGAGYFDLVPGFDGKPNAIPKSIDFDSMDEAEFSELHNAVNTFLWTARAQETLWPHLDAEGRYRCVEHFLREFE